MNSKKLNPKRPPQRSLHRCCIDTGPKIIRFGAAVFFVALCLIGQVQCTPKAIDLWGASRLEDHQPNYCNNTDLLLEAGLLRSPLGQFLGFPCSNEFFHCRWQSDGYRTYKKNCRTGLVYDTLGTQNCNYDYNVPGCALTSDTAKCKEKDFACPLSENCVTMGQRCDGKYDCVLEEDEQNCPMCKPSEFACIIVEQCIPLSQRCNGVPECQDGTDEHDCKGCGQGKFYCRKSGKCISAKDHCDGIAHCPHGEDELLCKKSQYRMFVCENRRHQIPRENLCDGIENCPDGSDEAYCQHALPITSPDTSRAVGSNIKNSIIPDQSVEYELVTENPMPPTTFHAPFPIVEFVATQSSPSTTQKGTTTTPIPCTNDMTTTVSPPEFSHVPCSGESSGVYTSNLPTNNSSAENGENEQEHSGAEQIQNIGGDTSMKSQSEQGPIMVEGDYQTIGEFAPAPPNVLGKVSLERENMKNISLVANQSLTSSPTIASATDNQQIQQETGNDITSQSESGQIVEKSTDEMYPITKTEDGSDHAGGVIAGNVDTMETTLSPNDLSTMPSSSVLSLTSSTPSTQELISRGVHIPLKKYPFVNPWKSPTSIDSTPPCPKAPEYEKTSSEMKADGNPIQSNPYPREANYERLCVDIKSEENAPIVSASTDSNVQAQDSAFSKNNNSTKDCEGVEKEQPLSPAATNVEEPCIEEVPASSSTTLPGVLQPDINVQTNENDNNLLQRLATKYGKCTRDVLRRIEEVLQADAVKQVLPGKLSSAQTSLSTDTATLSQLTSSTNTTTAPVLFHRLPSAKTIRIASPSRSRKWRPSVSNVRKLAIASDAPIQFASRKSAKKKTHESSTDNEHPRQRTNKKKKKKGNRRTHHQTKDGNRRGRHKPHET
ncbi:low-density lipoprotein receptor domain class A domain-containing protein [Ditylenchus destructor]|uniref:Low-density lipoprotein receptor domain class A domain-containing protein n=1 Tax=Ditylenchus destructor TaxID=166010 RepID=A0AAD4NDZ3_9BILA|nr:low-density lipoprotein receptor domain class A domain-containing protein [Ditylenchus destructor]